MVRYLFLLASAGLAVIVAAGAPATAAPVAAARGSVTPLAAPVVLATDEAPRAPVNGLISAPSVERDMVRLAEIMGSLTWLRKLCGANDSRLWRDRMSALLEAESALPERKERLAGAYNSGYRAYSLTYKRCTPSAEAAIQRYLTEGGALTRALSARIAR